MNPDKASKIKGLAWLCAGLILAVVLAVGITPLVRAVPWAWEKGLGQAVGSAAAAGTCHETPERTALLKKLVSRIYPLGPQDGRFSIDVHVVRDADVNAYAELGGRITINSGLLREAESAEEVAGVLAHEITHVARRHILEKFAMHVMTIGGLQMVFGSTSQAQWTKFFLGMGFSRVQEREADEEGLARLQRARIDNRPFGRFFERMKEMAAVPDFVSDHPSNEARAGMVEKFSNEGSKPVMTPEEWKLFKGYCQ